MLVWRSVSEGSREGHFAIQNTGFTNNGPGQLRLPTVASSGRWMIWQVGYLWGSHGSR